MMRNQQALIFDCDGVLVNSEAIVDRIYRQHLERIGLNYSQAEFGQQLMGLTRDASQQALEERARQLGVAAPTPEFYTQVRADILQAFEHELIAIAGAHRLVSRWSGPSAVASSSTATAIGNSVCAISVGVRPFAARVNNWVCSAASSASIWRRTVG